MPPATSTDPSGSGAATNRNRTAPHRTAPHRTAPHRTAPHRTAPHRTAPHRTAPHRTAPHRTAPRPPAATFAAVGGEYCHHTDTQGYYRVGTYSDGSHGWYRRSGGWNRNGCRGSFMAMPMSGSVTQSDPQAYAVWWFKTGPVTSGRCTVSVYVPTGSARDVAGRPAYYQVVRGAHDMHVVSQFRIDQAANHGRWVTGGTFPVHAGEFALRLVNRGV